MGITIIIPVHDEEKRLLSCVERTIEFCNSQQWDYELIIVEDGSADQTVELIKNLISKYKGIKLISNKERLGKGRAHKKWSSYGRKKIRRLYGCRFINRSI